MSWDLFFHEVANGIANPGLIEIFSRCPELYVFDFSTQHSTTKLCQISSSLNCFLNHDALDQRLLDITIRIHQTLASRIREGECDESDVDDIMLATRYWVSLPLFTKQAGLSCVWAVLDLLLSVPENFELWVAPTEDLRKFLL